MLLTDLSVEEAPSFTKEAHRAGLDTIFLAAPTSTDRRLRLIYLADSALPTNEDGPLVEDVLFDLKAGATVVRVLGNGFPAGREWDTEFRRLRSAWIYWLDSLKHLLEAEQPRSATMR